MSAEQHFFLVEILECMTYMILDFCINETASALEMQYSFPVPKNEAKQMLVFAHEFVVFLLSFKEKTRAKPEEVTAEQRHLLERLVSAACKLVSYVGGYL